MCNLADAFRFPITDHTLPPLTPESLLDMIETLWTGMEQEIILTPREESE